MFDLRRLAIALLAYRAIWPAALAQQQSPAIPRPAPLLGLDGSGILGTLPSAPIAEERSDLAARSGDEVKSLDPPRSPVDPGLLR